MKSLAYLALGVLIGTVAALSLVYRREPAPRMERLDPDRIARWPAPRRVTLADFGPRPCDDDWATDPYTTALTEAHA